MWGTQAPNRRREGGTAAIPEPQTAAAGTGSPAAAVSPVRQPGSSDRFVGPEPLTRESYDLPRDVGTRGDDPDLGEGTGGRGVQEGEVAGVSGRAGMFGTTGSTPAGVP